MKTCFSLLALLCCLLYGRAAEAAPAPRHADNAVWLDDSYVTDLAYVAKVPELVKDSKENYAIKTWFVNVGSMNGAGELRWGEAAIKQIVPFLKAVKTAEAAEGTKLEIFAYLSGNLTASDANFLDLSKPATRRGIIALSKKYVSSTIEGNYVGDAGRAFDGVMIDLEPSGLDAARFGHLQTLMRELKADLGPTIKTGVAAHKHGNSTTVEWYWSDSFYHYMARHVDYIASMNYNSGMKTPETYQNWMQTQTSRILRAVSGKTWNNDANHPAPTNGVKVLMGFPAYPEPEGREHGHVATAENTHYAAQGTDAGLKDVDEASRSYFQGAALYMHSDGTGTDGYANKATDWVWWRKYWLGID